MALPSFTVTGNLFEITGAVTASELLESAPETLRFTFTPNLANVNNLVSYDGNLYRVGVVYAGVKADGTVLQAAMANGVPVLSDDNVKLLAEDSGLNVSGLQYTVKLETPEETRWKELASWSIDAYADGAQCNLAAIIQPSDVSTVNYVLVTRDFAYAADIVDAGSTGRSVLRTSTAAAARAAISALAPDDVATEIAEAIADDGTVVDAAAAAVDTAVEDLDLLEADTVESVDVALAFTDEADKAALSVNLDGSVTIAKMSADSLWRGPTPTWATRVNSWSPEKALYNYHPTALQNWFAGLARAMAGTGTAHITTFVDSETYGAAGTGVSQPKWLNSWPGRLRRQLDALTGYTSGTGIAVPWNTVTSTPADDPRWTFGDDAVQAAGEAVADPKYGVLGRGAIQLTNDVGDGWLEFEPVEAVTQFTIYALADSGASGTATVKVDGGSVGTIDVSAAGGGGTITRRSDLGTNILVFDVTGLSDATHALRIEGPAASTVTIWGIEGGTGGGVRVSNLSRSSCDVSQLVLDDDTNNTYGMGLHVDTAAADLAILMLGLNDRDSSSTPFKAAIVTAITRLQAAGSDILFVCPGQPDYDTLPNDLAPRLTDMYELADTYDLPLLDMAWVRTDFDTADALGLLGDGIHSNDTGAEHHARFIFNALTGV